MQLRRASGPRMSHDEDSAAELARRARVRAAAATSPPSPRRSSWVRRFFGARSVSRLVPSRWRSTRRRRRGIPSPSSRGKTATIVLAAAREIGMIDFGRGRRFAARSCPVAPTTCSRPSRSGCRLRELIMASPVGPSSSRSHRFPSGPSASSSPRRPHRRHVDGHRDGLARYGRSCTSVLGAAPRGDPAGDEPPVRAGHRE